MTLATLHHNLNGVLALAAGTLPKHYKLTLVARNTNPKFPDADVVLTDDDLNLAITTINKMKDRENFKP